MKIHYSGSLLKFLKANASRNNVCAILYDVYQYQEGCSYYENCITDAEVNYLTFRENGLISYLPAGKPHKTGETGNWLREGRQDGKAAKVIRKLFTPLGLTKVCDKDFENFANSYKNAFNDDGYTFTLRPNTDIPEVYTMQAKVGDCSLNNSCMRGKSNIGKLEMYTHCSQLSILTLTDKDNLLCGRALVWKPNDSITIMDRIYVVSDFLYEKFLGYAETQGWLRKEYYRQYDYPSLFVNSEGKRVDATFEIETPTQGFNQYPYIDTFCYGKKNVLMNYQPRDCIYNYHSQYGDRSVYEVAGQTIRDRMTNATIEIDESVTINAGSYLGRVTHNRNTVTINEFVYYKADTHYIVEYDEEYYLKTDCVWMDDDDLYVPKSLVVYSTRNCTWYMKDQVVEIDGNFYDINDDEDLIVRIQGKYYLKDSDRIYTDRHGIYRIKAPVPELQFA